MHPPGTLSFPVFRPFHLAQLRAASLRPRVVLLEPWLREGSLTLLHGPRGVGKTYLALAIAHAIATGTELFGWRAPAPRRVLFLDGEMTVHDLQRAARSLPVSAHDTNLVLVANDDEVEPLDLAHAPHRTRLEPLLEDVALIVIDNLATLAQGGSENAAESWAPLEAWALGQRRRNRAVLFVHHSGRLGQQRGTTRREDRMDTILALRPAPAEPGASGARFELHLEKHRGSLPAASFPLRAWLSPQGWCATPLTAPLADDIGRTLIALTHAGQSVRDIAAALGLPRSTIHRMQQSARQRGELAAVPSVPAVPVVPAVPNGVCARLGQKRAGPIAPTGKNPAHSAHPQGGPQTMLTPAQVAAYRRDGYHFPVDILSPAETAACRRQLEAYEASAEGPIKGNLRQKPHLLFAWLNDLIRHPKILDAVESIHGPDLLCWSSSFFIKEPQHAGYVSWHQDSTYWGLSTPDVLTVWLAFTPANEVNGAMKFLPGSQHEQAPHMDTFHEHNLLSRGQELAVEVDEKKSVLVELLPGQASLHHVMLHHGSAPNRSADRRIGFAIRYIPTHVSQIAGARDSATLVRGVDRYNHFDLEPAPAYDMAPEAVALHAAMVRQQATILYRGTGKEEFRA